MIPYGKWHSVAVRWIWGSINSYTALYFFTNSELQTLSLDGHVIGGRVDCRDSAVMCVRMWFMSEFCGKQIVYFSAHIKKYIHAYWKICFVNNPPHRYNYVFQFIILWRGRYCSGKVACCVHIKLMCLVVYSWDWWLWCWGTSLRLRQPVPPAAETDAETGTENCRTPQNIGVSHSANITNDNGNNNKRISINMT